MDYNRYTNRQWKNEKHTRAYECLAEIEDKIENGTLIELPKKCYQVVWCLGWEIVEYDIVETTFDHKEGIVSVEATCPHSVEYFTKYNRYNGRVLGEHVFFTEAEAEAKLAELKGERE